MDSVIFTLLISFLIWATIYLSTSIFRRSGKLPPGPFPLPIIGNIHQLGQNPNQSMAKLAKIYGPIMSLRLGSRFTVVVSSPSMAKEVLQKNDQFLASRTTANAVQAHDHYKVSVAWLSPSNQWRNLRKISKEQMFTIQRLDAGESLRQKKIRELCDYVRGCSLRGESVNIGEAAFTTTLNLITTTLFSVDFAAYNSDTSQELKEIVSGVTELAGTPNFADYFPFLRFFDPQGIMKESRYYFGKLLDAFDDYISQREDGRNSLGNNYVRKNDMLEALLDHRDNNPSELTRKDIKHLLLVSLLTFYLYLYSFSGCFLMMMMMMNGWLGFIGGGIRHNISDSDMGNGTIIAEPRKEGKSQSRNRTSDREAK